MRQIDFGENTPTFYSFAVRNVYMADTMRVASFELHLEQKRVLTVTDVNANNTNINTLIIDTESHIHLPYVQKAVAEVRRDYKATEYQNKDTSSLIDLLNKGYNGAVELVAELALLCVQAQVAMKYTAEYIKVMNYQDVNKVFYEHMGNTKLFFDMQLLAANTVYQIFIELETSTNKFDIEEVTARVMQVAKSHGQYVVGILALPIGHDWINHMTLEKLLAIYL